MSARATLVICLVLASVAAESSRPRSAPHLAVARPPTIVAAQTKPEQITASSSELWRTLGEQSKRVVLTISRFLLIDYHTRGRDQRRPWVRALAYIHPSWRLAVIMAVLLLILPLWLRHDWASDGDCRTLQLATLHLCSALVKFCGGCAAVGTAAGSVLLALRRAAVEESKDHELSEEHFAAAAAAASYAAAPEDRLTELHERGVESRNWRVDKQLSTETVATFFNWYTQSVWIAFRGTWSLQDWKSNLASIAPGDEMADERFQQNLEVARAAQHKYVLFKSIRVCTVALEPMTCCSNCTLPLPFAGSPVGS